MGNIVIDGKTYKVNNLMWSDKRGDCDYLLCRKSRSCNYSGSKKKCISQLTGHACKHFVKASPVEQKKIDSLLRSEEICNPTIVREIAIHIKDSDTALEVRNNNEAVICYEQLCGLAERKVVCGWKSKDNIRLACGFDYQGYSIILNDNNDILSFYYAKSLEKNNMLLLSDYYMYSLIKSTMKEESLIDGEYSYSHFSFLRSDLREIRDAGRPIEGECFYYLEGGTGISSKINYAFSFAKEIQTLGKCVQSILFNYYYSPEVIKSMIAFYDEFERGKKKDAMINNNQSNILTMYKLHNYQKYYLPDDFCRHNNSEEEIYLEEYRKSKIKNLTPDNEIKIKQILEKNLEEELEDLVNKYNIEYANDIYLDSIDDTDDEQKNVNKFKRDLLAFEIAQRRSELALLAGEDRYSYEDIEDECIKEWIELFKYTDAR